MDTAGEVEQGNEGRVSDAAIARRRLLKAAIGTGVAAAVYSAPKISVVPAYGLTSSNRFNNKCYAIGWSSNNPTGKGWMGISTQSSLFGSSTLITPDIGPSADVGNGTATYKWTIAAFDSVPAFTLQIVASGCVNDGTASWTVSGLPTGYCLKFYNSGSALDDTAANTCGATSPLAGTLSGFPNGSKASPTSVVNNGVVTISTQGRSTCISSGLGKMSWRFDIGPC